MIYLIL